MTGASRRDRVDLCLILLLGLAVMSGVSVAPLALKPPVYGVTNKATQNVLVDQYQLEYSGNDVSGMTIVINNTGGEVTVDVTGKLQAMDGSTVASKTSTVLLTSDGRKKVSISFDTPVARSQFMGVVVTVS